MIFQLTKFDDLKCPLQNIWKGVSQSTILFKKNFDFEKKGGYKEIICDSHGGKFRGPISKILIETGNNFETFENKRTFLLSMNEKENCSVRKVRKCSEGGRKARRIG